LSSLNLLQAAFLVISHIGGKLLLFQSSVPSVGIGRVKNRENMALYGTEREPTMRNPEDGFFKRFAAECSRVQITVDVFAASMQYMDLASLAAIPRFTCGEVREGLQEGGGRESMSTDGTSAARCEHVKTRLSVPP
jgi:protein transport protein SEC24